MGREAGEGYNWLRAPGHADVRRGDWDQRHSRHIDALARYEELREAIEEWSNQHRGGQ